MNTWIKIQNNSLHYSSVYYRKYCQHFSVATNILYIFKNTEIYFYVLFAELIRRLSSENILSWQGHTNIVVPSDATCLLRRIQVTTFLLLVRYVSIHNYLTIRHLVYCYKQGPWCNSALSWWYLSILIIKPIDFVYRSWSRDSCSNWNHDD